MARNRFADGLFAARGEIGPLRVWKTLDKGVPTAGLDRNFFRKKG